LGTRLRGRVADITVADEEEEWEEEEAEEHMGSDRSEARRFLFPRPFPFLVRVGASK